MILVHNVSELRWLHAGNQSLGALLTLRLPAGATFDLDGEPLTIGAGMNVTLEGDGEVGATLDAANR